MEFFTAVFDALTTTQIDLKLQKVEYLQANFYTYNMQHDIEIKSIKTPSYAPFCKVIHPTRLQRPKGGNSKEALAKILLCSISIFQILT